MSESRATVTPSQTSSSSLRTNAESPRQHRKLPGQGFAVDPGQTAVLQLQRQLGNQGVQTLWGSRRLQRMLGLQRQLEVGAADNPLEHEANRTADLVMAMPAADSNGKEMQMQPAPLTITRMTEENEDVELQRHPEISRMPETDEEAMQYKLQRACADCEEMQARRSPLTISRMPETGDEDMQLQRKPGGMDGDAKESLGYTHAFEKMDDEEDLGTTTSLYMKRARPPARLQRDAISTNAAAAASGAGGQVSSSLAANINSLRSRGGSPLGRAERNFFEPRFGRDFSDVRVHAGPDAANIARQVNARAFTIGRDVVFGAGEYRPDTNDGRRLMAHELTHTVQQGAAGQTLAAKPVLRRQTMLRRERNEQPAPRQQSETEQFIRSVAVEALPILVGRAALLPLHAYLRARGLKMHGVGVGFNMMSGAALGAYAQTNVISYAVYGIKAGEIDDVVFYAPELGGGPGASWDGIGVGAVVSLIYTKDASPKALIDALGGTSSLAQVGFGAMAGVEFQVGIGNDLMSGKPGAVSIGVTLSGGKGGGGFAMGTAFANKLGSSVDKLNIPDLSSDGPGIEDLFQSELTYAQLVRAALNPERPAPGPIPGIRSVFESILALTTTVWAYCRPYNIQLFNDLMRTQLSYLGVPDKPIRAAIQSLTGLGWGSTLFPEGHKTHADFVTYTPLTLLKALLKSGVIEIKGDLCDAARTDAKAFNETVSKFSMAGSCNILTIEDVESN